MNIFDYLDYYKDLTFEEEKYNNIDALLFSIISYMPIKNMKNGITFNELNNLLSKVKKTDIHGVMGPIIIDIVKDIKDSKRYKDTKLYNLKKIVNKKVQFGAVTLRNKYFTFVSFEGTNASIIGWIENFMLTCKYPTLTQSLAIDYLDETLNFSDKCIYVGGHSKGGNLAMASVMNSNSKIFKKIKSIYNFDGPGFREEEYKTKEFKKMNDKCINVIPNESLIGILLNNDNLTVTKADSIGVFQHYPNKWNVFGSFFVKDKLSNGSTKVMNRIRTSMKKLNYKDAEKLLNKVNELFINNSIIYTDDFKKLKFNDFIKIINEYNDIEPNTKKILLDIALLLIKTKE